MIEEYISCCLTKSGVFLFQSLSFVLSKNFSMYKDFKASFGRTADARLLPVTLNAIIPL